MKVHKLLCAGAAFAMLGAHAQAEEGNFFGGLKLRGAVQMYPREDMLMPYYGGAAYELGYNFSFGRMSAELGILYKPGRLGLIDISQMENQHSSPINQEYSFQSHKNQIQGITFRVAYEKPMEKFSLRSGLQFGALKFRQEMIGDVRSTAMDAPPNGTFPLWRDTYNGVNDTGGLSISPFFGISVPVLSNHFIETNFVLLNYTAGNYIHVAGTEEGRGPGQSKKDYIKENGRLIPHIEIAFGFRF